MYEIADPNPGPLEELPPVLLRGGGEELDLGVNASGWEEGGASPAPGSACFAWARIGFGAG